MHIDLGTIVAGVVSASIAAASLVYVNRVSKRVPATPVGDAYAQIIDELRKDVTAVREDLISERKETRRLRLRVARLEELLRDAGLPVPNGVEP